MNKFNFYKRDANGLDRVYFQFKMQPAHSNIFNIGMVHIHSVVFFYALIDYRYWTFSERTTDFLVIPWHIAYINIMQIQKTFSTNFSYITQYIHDWYSFLRSRVW